jgi:3-vinyl bacteriochlorophyllide hydratase
MTSRSRTAPRPTALSATLYTDEQRRRRDRTVWTRVQGVLAPLQFVVCAVSAGLMLRYLAAGEGLALAEASFILKCALLALIMVTGSIWEKVVFGRWLFAPVFFWEDVVSMAVIALHALSLWAMLAGALDPRARLWLALLAYAVYVINAVQFLLKLRAARRGTGPAALRVAARAPS